jgi:hypothetical protein
MTLPSRFTEDGLLPPGDYELTLGELRESMLVYGPEDRSPTWDSTWRGQLVGRLEVLVNQLWQVGIAEVFVDGSFVEDKDHPNDIDGYFVCDLMRLATGELERELNLLDSHKAWTWDPASRKPYAGFTKSQLPMWHIYRTELYPHYGQPSGIRSPSGHMLNFPEAFRQTRGSGQAKGIIKLRREP